MFEDKLIQAKEIIRTQLGIENGSQNEAFLEAVADYLYQEELFKERLTHDQKLINAVKKIQSINSHQELYRLYIDTMREEVVSACLVDLVNPIANSIVNDPEIVTSCLEELAFKLQDNGLPSIQKCQLKYYFSELYELAAYVFEHSPLIEKNSGTYGFHSQEIQACFSFFENIRLQ